MTESSDNSLAPRQRSALSVTLSVWHAIFLREALDRLFDMRAAWLWLIAEPVVHIGFIALIWRSLRIQTIGGADLAVWTMIGMLGFFLYRRTALQVSYAVESNLPLFAYRQVKPFDTAFMRALLEAFLMAVISAVLLLGAALLGHDTLAVDDPLLVLLSAVALWLFALGYGLVASVLMTLVPESEHILKLLMMPLYLLSGVILPMSAVPEPYRGWLMYNPVANGLELIRLGYMENYHAVAETSLDYLLMWALSSLFLGLVLYRRFERKLVMQ
ncbi:ABC transporter permease [Herbaspirillum frisingense]|uniref:ABC transporter permease n=1 Tax=Herbaspirillum frisingense TaxID=92645 RepID=UPI001F38CC53|nr:ABC transporter permease [Herbaspirillum frisingense]UIN22232.1 ABC transporter permease [Herbaspirillum frisingense]